MENINLILSKELFSNTLLEYFYTLGLFFILFFVFRLFRKIILVKIKFFTKNTKNNFDDLFLEIFSGISKFFYWFIAFFVALQILTLPNILDKILLNLFILIIVIEVITILKKIIVFFVDYITERSCPERKSIYRIIGKALVGVVYVISFLFLLSAFGVNITALVAGLGVGGIAIAFALKEILADLFSYFTIILDKPIEVGDFIVVGDKVGTVKKIGIKTTRLESLDGLEIIVSNNSISSSFIDNSRKREYRREKFILGVTYETPVIKLKKIKPAIKKIVDKEKDTEFLRSNFKSFGNSALEFTVDYKVTTNSFDEYVELKERINFEILVFCEKEGIELAYPTMTIYQK